MEELVILANLEAFNAEMIKKGIDQRERFKKLREIAREQLTSLLNKSSKKQLK